MEKERGIIIVKSNGNDISNITKMKEYRVSGFIYEEGACQVDVEATGKAEAKQIAIDDYDFYKVVNVFELRIIPRKR